MRKKIYILKNGNNTIAVFSNVSKSFLALKQYAKKEKLKFANFSYASANRNIGADGNLVVPVTGKGNSYEVLIIERFILNEFKIINH
jgi:hypothetical protein